MSGTKQSKWVIPGALLVAAIIGWFFYDAYSNWDGTWPEIIAEETE